MLLLKWIVYTTFGIIVLFFVLVFMTLPSKDHKTEPVAAKTEPDKPICDVQKAAEVVAALNEAQLFRRMSIPADDGDFAYQKITVDDDWYLLDINDKSAFDSWVRCQLSGGLKSKMVAVSYLDPRTGKEVASSSMHSGFAIE